MVVLGGGPAHSPGHALPEAGVVNVFTETGEQVGRQSVRAGQRFVFGLTAGVYKLNTGRNGLGCPAVAVTVHPGGTTHVDVETLCSVP
jgi:hypothetical protein